MKLSFTSMERMKFQLLLNTTRDCQNKLKKNNYSWFDLILSDSNVEISSVKNIAFSHVESFRQ